MEKVKVKHIINLQALFDSNFQIVDMTKELSLVLIFIDKVQIELHLVDKDSLNEIMEAIKDK